MQHLDELAYRANMLYTAEDISAVFDCHPCHVVDLWQLGIIDVADGLDTTRHTNLRTLHGYIRQATIWETGA